MTPAELWTWLLIVLLVTAAITGIWVNARGRQGWEDVPDHDCDVCRRGEEG